MHYLVHYLVHYLPTCNTLHLYVSPTCDFAYMPSLTYLCAYYIN